MLRTCVSKAVSEMSVLMRAMTTPWLRPDTPWMFVLKGPAMRLNSVPAPDQSGCV
jgi:hypothetical protein